LKLNRHMLLLLVFAQLCTIAAWAQTSRWPEEKANSWYAQQKWLVGSNFVPKSAINQLEMWQEATFDLVEIDKEFAWAEKMGMNTMRVFLHDLLWEQDAGGFQKRIDQFVAVAARHHIRPIFVLFDSCWDPSPHLGPQHPPIPGIHNSGWVQSPGAAAMNDPKQEARILEYVSNVILWFADDDRILAWDVWNEPDNLNTSSYGAQEPTNKIALVTALLPKIFTYARSGRPSQPLTSGDASIDVAAAHLYEQSRRDAFNRLATRDALMADAEPERLGVELVNRYHAVKRAGLI